MKSHIPINEFKSTKIIATVGPSTMSYEAIFDLIEAGVNGLRLNFSHGTHEEKAQQIKWIRKASKEQHKPVAIIQDLQGPKIRLGDFEGAIKVKTGQSLNFKYKADYAESGLIPVQYDLSKKVRRGEQIYLYDGRVRTVVTSVQDGVIHTRAENNGELLKRKGMNLPDTDFSGDILTSKDKKDMAFGSTQDIDYVALSFVHTADDLHHARRILHNLGSTAKLIGKVETKAAVENLDEIVEASDAVMIARGDLAFETMPESVPIVQRKIIGLGMKYAKPTIVATQMLASMTEMPEPTRAEVSDVATAVIVGADCVMLSDETANGQYPIESVEVMKRIVVYTQENMPVKATFLNKYNEAKPTRQDAICRTIMNLAEQVGAKAIVAETRSGATAWQIAARRPKQPVIAVTSDPRVAQQLALVFNTKGYVRPDSPHAAVRLTDWLRENKVLKKGDIVVSASGHYPGVVGTTDTIKVRVLE